MRRKEYALSEEQREDVEQFLNTMSYGILAMNSDEVPDIKPLNYIYMSDAIYLHGSKAGEKMKTLKVQQKAVFSIVQDYAFIPSYLDDPYFACPASTLYKSVIITGDIAEVVDEKEKHDVLDGLMKKLQPEGGYAPIVYDDEQYRKRVKATAVLKLNILSLDAKFKFGQNWKEEKRERVKEHLDKRNLPLDADTIALMEKYCPYHQKTE